MAYPKSSITSTDGGNQTVEFTADVGDFLLLISASVYGTAGTPPAGWSTFTYSSNSQGGWVTDVWYKIATVSGLDSVTVENSSSSHKISLTIYGGVDPVTPFDVTPTSRPSNYENPTTMPAITPVTDNALIVYVTGSMNSSWVPINAGLIELSRIEGNARTAVYYTGGLAAGETIPAFDFMTRSTSSGNPTMIAIALRDNGSVDQKGFVDITKPPAELLHLLGRDGESGAITDTTGIDLSAATGTGAISVIDGQSTEYRKLGSGDVELVEGVSTLSYSSADSVYSACVLCAASFTPAIDLTGKIIAFTSFGSPGQYEPFNKMGRHFGLGDGTNFRVWKTDAIDTKPTGSAQPICCAIEVDGGFEDSEHGVVNGSVISALNHIVTAGVQKTRYRYAGVGFLWMLKKLYIQGGSASFPASFVTAVDASDTCSLRTVFNQADQSSTQFFCLESVSVGDGVNGVHFNCDGHYMEWPAASDTAEKRVQALINPGVLSFTLNNLPGNVSSMKSATFNMGNYHKWELVSSGDMAEIGLQILYATPILHDIGRAVAGVTLSGCLEITGDCDMSGGNTFIDCHGGQWVTVTNETEFSRYHNANFVDNSLCVKITGDQAGNWSDPSWTVSGNTVEIEYTGSTDFEIQSAVALTVVNSGAGTLTIATPQIALTVALPAGVTGVFIINDVDTADPQELGAELQRNNSATGNQIFNYQAVKAGDEISLQLIAPGYKRFIKKITLPATSSPYSIDAIEETN